MENSKVIVVDLDGTLIKFDSSFAIALKLARQNPLLGLRFLWIYLSAGEAKVKQFVAQFFEDFDYETNVQLVNFLRKQRKNGAKLIMATGANLKVAQKVNKDFTGLFDGIVASDMNVNCIGINKLTRIRELIGNSEFLYIGDYWHDLPIWNEATEIGIVINKKDRAQLLDLVRKIADRENKKLLIFSWDYAEFA